MRKIQFREALREAMSEEMRRDERVFLMGEEVAEYNGAYKVSQGMLEEFGPKRVIDTPISELGFAGIGVGAAMNGLRPIIEFMTFNFSLVAIDQVVNSAAKMYQMSGGQFNVPIVFRGPTASAGQLAAQHSQAFESWYANCPGLKVIVPSTPYDAKGLLKAAIRDDDPVIFMESEQMYGDIGEVPEGEYIIPIGKADIKREGSDVTIVTFGKITKVALAAADELAKEGISAEVVDLRTVRPIDYETVINSVKKTNRMVVVEEAWPLGSIATEVTFAVQRDAFDYLDAPVRRVTSADTPLGYAPTLVAEYLPNPERVIRAVKQVLYIA
jgi:pyruvate dehydrogenase E1 component beta subunit